MMQKLYLLSFFFDNILYVFSYFFILHTDLFWDVIFCEKIKNLYDMRDQLPDEEDRYIIEASHHLAHYNLKRKQKRYKLIIISFILVMIFIEILFSLNEYFNYDSIPL